MGLGPQRKDTPRTGLEDQISQLLGVGLTQAGGPSVASGGKGGNKVTGGPATLQDIYTNLSVPQYQGALTAPNNPLQQQALGAAGAGLDQLGSLLGTGGDLVKRLMNPNQSLGPQDALSTLRNLPGSDILNTLASGGGAVGALNEAAGSSAGDFGGILDALRGAQKGSLSDNLRDVSERFSTSGLRGSTDLASALGETANRSEANFLGQAAQLLPQLTGQRTQALSQAGQLGLGAGQLLQGGGLQSANILGQLFQGQQGRALEGFQTLPGVLQLLGTLPGQQAHNAFQLGAQQQGIDTQALQAPYQEFLRTQGALLAPILNFASGAPQITGPGKGSQLLQAGATIAGGAV